MIKEFFLRIKQYFLTNTWNIFLEVPRYILYVRKFFLNSIDHTYIQTHTFWHRSKPAYIHNINTQFEKRIHSNDKVATFLQDPHNLQKYRCIARTTVK